MHGQQSRVVVGNQGSYVCLHLSRQAYRQSLEDVLVALDSDSRRASAMLKRKRASSATATTNS